MTNSTQYVSAVTKPGVVIALYGPRGGTICVAKLSLSEAGSLHDQLTKTLTETTE